MIGTSVDIKQSFCKMFPEINDAYLNIETFQKIVKWEDSATKAKGKKVFFLSQCSKFH